MHEDDITLRVKKDDFHTVEAFCLELRATLFSLVNDLQATGVATSGRKSALLLIGGKYTERRKVHIYPTGKDLLASLTEQIELLAVPDIQKGPATLWLPQIKLKWDATIYLINRRGT